MDNRQAIEYASKNSFLALYEKGGEDTVQKIIDNADKFLNGIYKLEMMNFLERIGVIKDVRCENNGE